MEKKNEWLWNTLLGAAIGAAIGAVLFLMVSFGRKNQDEVKKVKQETRKYQTTVFASKASPVTPYDYFSLWGAIINKGDTVKIYASPEYVASSAGVLEGGNMLVELSIVDYAKDPCKDGVIVSLRHNGTLYRGVANTMGCRAEDYVPLYERLGPLKGGIEIIIYKPANSLDDEVDAVFVGARYVTPTGRLLGLYNANPFYEMFSRETVDLVKEMYGPTNMKEIE